VTDLETLAHDAATAFAAEPAVTGMALRTLVGDNRWASTTYDAAGQPALVGQSAAAAAALNSFVAELGGRPAGRTMVVEILIRASGDFEVSYTLDLNELSPQVVFDPDYRYPRHPRVGAPSALWPAPVSRPTDPAVLAEVESLIAAYVERYTAIRGFAPQFGIGASEEEIAAVERRLGLRLPDDVRAVYRTIHGDDDHGLLGYFCPRPLAEVEEHRALRWPFEDRWSTDLFVDMPIVLESVPVGHLRRISYSDRWISFAQDYGGNWLAVDLDPGPLGREGQLLAYGRDVYDTRRYLASSTVDLLGRVVASMDDPERLPEIGDDEETVRLWPPNGSSFSVFGPDHDWNAQVGAAGLAAAVAAVAEPELIQLARITDIDRARLAELAPLRNLRAIHVAHLRQPADEIDLTAAPDQPLELLRVYSRRFDPAALAGHPTLWHLTLGANTAPISIAILPELPGLLRLDLAGAEVPDLGPIADSSVKVLTLTAAQWSQLRASGYSPADLYGAELGGHPTVGESIDWLNWIRPQQPASRVVVRGRL
jgi:cell wall assembly regulator SMI1